MAEPLSAVFRRPFAEQVAALRLRTANLVPTASWDDLWQSQHDTGFMVAGAIKADLLADLAAAIDRAVAEGQTLETFRKDFRAIVAKHGWHGWTGEGTTKGEAWRTRVIYRTNMSTSYMAGRHAQLQAGGFEYWVYRHSGAEHPRLDHLSWNGIILPPDHPFWVQHYPPNGWGCGCKVFGARSEAGAMRVGGIPGKALPEGWDRIDAKTGAQVGIGRGWGYAPGATAADAIRSMTAKTVNWPYELAKAYMSGLPQSQADAFARSYRALPSVADDARRYAERAMGERNGSAIRGQTLVEPYRTFGMLSSEHVGAIRQATGLETGGYDFALDQSSVRHIFRVHGAAVAEAQRGQIAITAADFRFLPLILDAPDAVEDAGQSDVGRPVVRFSKRIGDRLYTVTLEIRGKKRRMVAVQSMWIRIAE